MGGLRHMTPKQIERYNKSREAGMFRYIFVRGILSFSLPMASTYLIFNLLSDSLNGNWRMVIAAWLIGGAIFGVSMWFIEGKVYSKYSLEKNNTPPS